MSEEKKPALVEFKEIMKSKGWDTTPITLNGHFIKFLDPDIDNMWLGFCAAKGLLDRALNRENEIMKEVVK